MKSKPIIVVLSLVVLFIAVQAQVFAGYNREVVVNAMRNNAKLMGELKGAIAKQDFFKAAESLMGIAESSKKLLDQKPPKGSKATWDRIHSDLIKTAFEGIGACGNEDIDALNRYVGKIGALMQEGHSTFRK